MNNERVTISRYISILYRSSNSYVSKKLADYNIGAGQFPYLIHLYCNEGITQEQISCNLCIDKGTTAKSLKKLEEAGYVYRKVDEKDKRAHKVYLHDKAKNIMSDIYSILDQWDNIITADLSEEEKLVALKLLQRMVESKNKIIKKGDY
jgi:DNA-binding MarR family transcriptional regulator